MTQYECHECDIHHPGQKPCTVNTESDAMEDLTLCVANGCSEQANFKEVAT